MAAPFLCRFLIWIDVCAPFVLLSIDEIKREVDILKKLRNTNVVNYYGCWGPDIEVDSRLVCCVYLSVAASCPLHYFVLTVPVPCRFFAHFSGKIVDYDGTVRPFTQRYSRKRFGQNRFSCFSRFRTGVSFYS